MRYMSQTGDAAGAAFDALVFFHFEGEPLSPILARVDAALHGSVAAMLETKEFKGAAGEVASLVTLGNLPSKRVLIAGLGKAEGYSAEALRRASGRAARALRTSGAITAGVEMVHAGSVGPADAGRAVVEGMSLALYAYDRYFSTDRPALRLGEVTLFSTQPEEVAQGAVLAEIMAAATNFARDLVNEPPNALTPPALLERARTLAAEASLGIDVFDREELQRRGMGCLLAVGSGSATPPCLVALHYRGDPEHRHATLGLVGKGITFDSGGISLKPGADMHLMKTDMGGAAAMLGAMQAIAAAKPKLNVTAIVALAENMPDGGAYRPGDILRAMNGKTIEIQNTDAEGRLILADALGYAASLKLSPIVDAATLTRACSVALGPFYSALFANNDQARDQVLAAARTAGERFWPMPLDADYRPLLDSSCADMRNVAGRDGGAITAATFLREFVDDQPWVHLDIAPTAFTDSESAYFAKGLATGHPVRALVQLALDISSS